MEIQRAVKTKDQEAKRSIPYFMTAKGYLHARNTYIGVTLFIVALMTALWFVMGVGPNAQGTIPPAFSFGPSDLYFHSIAIGIAALAVYLVVDIFDLDKYEPNIDFPISYRATMATVIGAVGAFFYLRPVFNANFAPVPMGLIVVGLILLGDVGGALLVELYLLPAKLTGRYDSSLNRMGMIPKWKCLPKWSDFRKMDSTYWLVFATVISAFIAGLIGFVALWLNYFVIDIGASPAIFSGYIRWMGGAPAFLSYAVGSHSHVIGMMIMISVVAVVARKFGVLNLSGRSRSVAKFGLWVSVTGVALMTVVFLLEAFTTTWVNATPPLLFASNPGGFQLWSSTASNGMAGDDTTMLLGSLGGLIMLFPLLLTRLNGTRTWKDPLRASILMTWVLAYIATPVEGFYIEFHEATMSGGPADTVFGNEQFFALFVMAVLAMTFLALDVSCSSDEKFRDMRVVRYGMAIAGMILGIFTLIAGFVYTFYDPGSFNSAGKLVTTQWGMVYSAGLFVISLLFGAGAIIIYFCREEKIVPGEYLFNKYEN
ncbi:MAG: hypothetical protein KIY11_00540 [Thermoplasmata archaeon]|nr:hypothetical protein [Candidatus Sysuiplasma acidicola]